MKVAAFLLVSLLSAASTFAQMPDPPAGTFSLPLADKPLRRELGYTGSAFAVRYRERTFLVTVAHVVIRAGHKNPFFFFDRGEWVRIRSSWDFTTVDLAAVDITDQISPNKPGIMKLDNSDLIPGVSQLVAYCNSDLYAAPFVGKLIARPTTLELELVFAERRLENGCSGAALADYQGRIRGVVTSGVVKGSKLNLGYAIPSARIAQFLDQEFFKATP